MIMKRNIILYIAVVIVMCLMSCSEADKEMFDTSFASICFEPDSVADDNIINKDSILVFSFAKFTPDVTAYDVEVPILVTGMPADHDRQFSVAIIDSLTTARESVNYEALKNTYIMPAGAVCAMVPVTLLRTPDIQSHQLQIGLKAISSGDFGSPVIDEKSKIVVQFSDQLEKPAWWDYWIYWFGKFSRTKYQRWVTIYGTDETELKSVSRKVNNYAFMHPKVAVSQNELRNYFIENPTYDEDGELITVPALQ